MPRRPVYWAEPIRPGDPEDWFNRADDGCDLCGGMGSLVRHSERRPCVCVEQR